MDASTRIWQRNNLSESLDRRTVTTQYHSTILGRACFPPALSSSQVLPTHRHLGLSQRLLEPILIFASSSMFGSPCTRFLQIINWSTSFPG